MKRILIFGGTSEGRELAEKCVENGIKVSVSVATVTGSEALEGSESLKILEGRKNTEEIKALIESGDFAAVVDATHPFAKEVSENIKEAAKGSDIPLFRLKRSTAAEGLNADIRYFEDSAKCAEALQAVKGNILLTTGSKEAHIFAEKIDSERLFVRVLPAIESIEIVKKCGFANEHIIAMQGVFSERLNEALIDEFDISILVTKESGDRGGYGEKLRAAAKKGISVYVIESPEKKSGLSMDEVLDAIYDILCVSRREQKQIAMIGMGMGELSMLGEDAKKALEEAEVYIGAERLLNLIRTDKKKYKEYNAHKILEIIEKERASRFAVLFSGDTGFYSGAEGLKLLLENADKKDVRVFPGISSISYLASRAGVSWQDAYIVSRHGRVADVCSAVREHEKVFVLLSDAKDLKKLADELIEASLTYVRIIAGIALSSKDERIIDKEVVEYCGMELTGIACCFIINPRVYGRIITPGLRDSAFIRGNVPMTKEEVRSLSLCKLKLTHDAVVWDVGAGTGSVSVECARMDRRIKVYSIERDEEACSLIHENAMKAGLSNLDIVKGEAPKALAGLEAPSHVFIGGSGGNLKEILELLSGFNKEIRVVINAIALETVSVITDILGSMCIKDEDIVLMNVSKGERRGRYHLMHAGNPVYIFSFTINQGD